MELHTGPSNHHTNHSLHNAVDILSTIALCLVGRKLYVEASVEVLYRTSISNFLEVNLQKTLGWA